MSSCEVEYLQNKLNDVRKELDKEKKKEMMRNVAEDIHLMYDAFVTAGFTDDQAWYMTGTFFEQKLC